MPSIINATTSTGLVSSADNSGSLQLATNNGTTAVTIDTSQRVGIGTSSPAFTLDVRAATSVISAVSTTGTNAAYMFASNTGGDFYLGRDNSAGTSFGGGAYSANIYSAGAYPMVFWTNATERMRLTSDGAILMGTSTSGGATGITFSNASDSAAYGKSMYMNSPYNGTRNAISFAYNSSGVGAIVTGTSSTSYNSGSDYRLKNGIQPITNALQKVALLKPSKWTWKVDNTYGDGFVAHELAEVCPHAVTGEKDAVDADGKPVYQGVDTSFLVATLTAAIQELKAELDATKAEVQALKGVA